MQINLKSIESQWYDFPTPEGDKIRLKIRYYPLGLIENTFRRQEDGRMEVIWKNSERKKRYMYCFEAAEGLVDADGKPIKLDAEILLEVEKNGKTEKEKVTFKEIIFDYDHILLTGIPAFVLEKGEALTELKEIEEKN